VAVGIVNGRFQPFFPGQQLIAGHKKTTAATNGKTLYNIINAHLRRQARFPGHLFDLPDAYLIFSFDLLIPIDSNDLA
jgi:hypothetical protein